MSLTAAVIAKAVEADGIGRAVAVTALEAWRVIQQGHQTYVVGKDGTQHAVLADEDDTARAPEDVAAAA
jgi:hypothetical protein